VSPPARWPPEPEPPPNAPKITLASDRFIAWTLGVGEGTLLAALPPGEVGWPIDHDNQIRHVFLKVFDSAKRVGFLTTLPALQIRPEPQVNAYAINGNTVAIYLALSELISDSPSELAFVVGHELVHIWQQNNPSTSFLDYFALCGLAAKECEADVLGTILAMGAGYDPYGATRFLTSMGRSSELRSGSSKTDTRTMEFLSSHPATPERVRNAQINARQFLCF
jgi:Zn-dependent protease with chaperone function